MKAFYAKMSRRNKIILGVAAVIVLILIFVIGNRDKGNANSQFQTVKAERGQLTATIGATGTVRAAQSAILNWQTTGTVGKVNVQVGDQVKKDDVLASLRQDSLPPTVIQAQADLASAQKALQDLMSSDTASAQAAIDLKDARDAYKKAYDYRLSLNGKQWIKNVVIKYVNGQEVPEIKWQKGYVDSQTIQDADNDLALKKAQLDDAQRNYDRLRNGPNPNDVAAAQARVDAAQATLDTARIAAPFAGVLTQAEPLPGDQVSIGELAFRVDDLSRLLVDVQVSEVDINSVAVDQPVTLTLDAVTGKTYHGLVAEVSQAGDVSSGAVNFTVTVQMTDADSQVKPGMTAAVNIVTNQVKDKLLVPNRAVRLVDGSRVIYILKNGQPQRIPITLGASSDTTSVVQGGGLKEGDLIILNPPAQFQGGPFGGGG